MSRLRGGVLAVMGYLLSPLSWWNDLFINLPLAYGFALLFSLIARPLFVPMMIVGYWLTNVAGFFLLHKGASELVSGRQSRGLLKDLITGTAYTGLIVVLALIGVLKPPFPQDRRNALHFAREEVYCRVRPGCVEVTGKYHFLYTGAAGKTAGIFYPFPRDTLYAQPDSVALPGHDYAPTDSGLFFRMRFEPKSEDSFTVYYRQPLNGRTARYIVTTTRAWHRAIDRAEFVITVPASFQGISLSYQPDEVEETDSIITYRFVRRKFYPDKDVVISWQSD